jgi:hypothetical protein
MSAFSLLTSRKDNWADWATFDQAYLISTPDAKSGQLGLIDNTPLIRRSTVHLQEILSGPVYFFPGIPQAMHRAVM